MMKNTVGVNGIDPARQGINPFRNGIQHRSQYLLGNVDRGGCGID